jgi:hypothetical protein
LKTSVNGVGELVEALVLRASGPKNVVFMVVPVKPTRYRVATKLIVPAK